ncbi:ABC transporter permease [Jiangella mangrovi]|nr:ABC transporter permease [Jiangella mangrovi]
MTGRPAPETPGAGPAGRRERRALWDRPWFLRSVTLFVFVAGWQVFAMINGGLMFPTAFGTIQSLGELLVDPELWSALWVSNQALLIGFPLAIVTGIPLGLYMGRARSAEKFVDPYMNILLVTPMAALTPLLLMSVGIGLTSRVIFVYIFALPMIVVHARTGIRQVDISLVEMSRSLRASELQIWRRIFIPSALPAIMTGIRIGTGRAVTGMILAELLLVSVGIGGMVLEFRGFFASEKLYAAVIIVVIESLLLVELARYAERRLAPWAVTGNERAGKE